VIDARDGYEIDDDPTRLQLDRIHNFLAHHAYWSCGIPQDVAHRAMASSLNFGIYRGEVQIGFARVVTDRATFAWLCDVYVLPNHRGRGLGHWLIQTVLAHPDLHGIRRMLLATADAHNIYSDCGFHPLTNPGHWMEIAISPEELYGMEARDSPEER
jgi:GNAT superfamily N-acetyltransferase